VQPDSITKNGAAKKRGRPKNTGVAQVDRKAQSLNGKSHGEMNGVNLSTDSATLDSWIGPYLTMLGCKKIISVLFWLLFLVLMISVRCINCSIMSPIVMI
jgi:hypothetical protein